MVVKNKPSTSKHWLERWDGSDGGICPTSGEVPTHLRRARWSTRLAGAKKRGWFRKVDAALANSYLHCAVGERLGQSEYSFRPSTNQAAYDLSMRFFHAIGAQDVARAQEIYDQIQRDLAKEGQA